MEYEIDFIRVFIPKLSNQRNNVIENFVINKYDYLKQNNIMLCRKDFRSGYTDFNINIYYIFNDDIKNLEELKIRYHWHTVGKYQNRISNIKDFFKKYNDFDNKFFYITNKKLIEEYYKENYILYFDIKKNKLNQELINMKMYDFLVKNEINFIKSIYDFIIKYHDINIEIIGLLNKNLFKNHISKKRMTDIEIKDIIYFYCEENEKEDRKNIFNLKEFYEKYDKFDLEIFRKFNKKFEKINEIICISEYHYQYDKNRMIGSLNDFVEKNKDFNLEKFKENMLDKKISIIDNLVKYNENEEYRNELEMVEKNTEKIYDNFDWEFYLDIYPDLKINGIFTEKEAYSHWINYGKKEGRKCCLEMVKTNKKKKKNFIYKYKNLFHKYILGLGNRYKTIDYKIINENKSKRYINNKLFCHIHCYDLDEFDNYFGNYINNILEYFSVIITYSIGRKLNYEKITLLKIQNKGMDIGGKIVILDYLNKNDINYQNILFLHSKKNKKVRDTYFKPFINSKTQINYICSIIGNYDLICPNLILNGDWHKGKYTINSKYYSEINKFLNLNELTNKNVEGNCICASRKLIENIFKKEYLELFYNILNDDNSFDYNWVNTYYKLNNNNINEVYNLYIKNKLKPNHLYDKKSPLISDYESIFDDSFILDKNLKDGAFEHIFERLWINTTINLNGKYKIITKDLIHFDVKDKYNFDNNLYRLLNNNYQKIENIVNFKKECNQIYSLKQILERLPVDFDIERYAKDNNIFEKNKYEVINDYLCNNNSNQKKWIDLTNEKFNKIKTFVYIFPQFHEIPENNDFWGEGFTEWWNVRKTFQAHNKHLPMYPHKDIGYYNILDLETRERWNNYANEYDFFGYIYCHFWFSKGIIMNKPLDKILEDGQPNKPWFLNWINENWTKRWDGGDNEILLEIDINLDKCKEHFNHLIKYFNHINYYKIDNKPCLGVYRPEEIPQNYIDLMNQLSIKNGFSGIIFMKTLNNDIDNQVIVNKNKYWEYEFEYPPNYSGTLIDARIDNNNFNFTCDSDNILNYNIELHYKKLITTQQKEKKLIRGIMPCWDNLPRHHKLKSKSHIQIGSNSLLFYFTLIRQFYNIKEEKGEYFFINSLNEWAEQCVMEPSIQNEYSYLEAFKIAKKTDLEKIDISLVDKFINY